MRQKLFYNAFNVLYTDVKEKLCIYQKEDFYRLLFEDIYRHAEDELLDNDSIRKITSGNSTVHRRVMKKLCTIDGFEIFRITIEKNYIKNSYNIECVLSKLFQILENNNIPSDTKRCIYQSITDSSDFQISRAIAGILVCTNHSDYISNRGKGDFLNIDFMRLSADHPILQYPRYISDAPDVAVEELIGREDELNKLYDKIVCKEEKLLISAVGGLGKTELIKHFLHKLTKTEVSTSGIEVIAWISYNNNDIRMSIKQALNLHCELDEVWLVLQNIVSEYNNRLLLVIDNIETVTNDEYLRKLDSLKCRMLVTSRQKSILGFTHILKLEPLKIEHCRDLFYKYYKFQEKDSEVVNDIIKLSAKLTIMIVFIAKIAFVEGLNIRKLYLNLVEKGFKLSKEDVSCEHEKLQNDKTIIKQMCILFSIARYDDDSKLLLTYISIIPNLKFDFSKAKRWFKTSKNSKLLKLFNMGMLEHTTKERTHIYWMHSVIAAAIREQQKETLYNLSRPFVSILSEELDCEDTYGREYEKAYLIPFSWSVADIMENHWNDEKDTDFLTSLFHVCFACSNYSLCEKLINNIIEIQKDEKTFGYMDLVYSYRNKIDLLLQFDRAEEASVLFDEVERIFKNKKASKDEKSILWSQYGILNQIRGDYQNSRKYFQKCIDNAEKNDMGTIEDVSTAYSNMARMLVDSGDLLEAYSYIKKAIDVKAEDAQDSNQIICYSTLAAICTELVSSGYVQYMDEAKESFKKVIEFREKNLGLHHADTAVVYHDYAYYLYIIEEYDEALAYNEKSNNIHRVIL